MKDDIKSVLIIIILLAIAISAVSYVAYPFIIYSDTFSITGILTEATYDNGTIELQIENQGTMNANCQDIDTYNDINEKYVGYMFNIDYRINKINNCVEILRYAVILH